MVTERRADAAWRFSGRERDQAFGRKYFLTLSPSVLNSTRVPRSWRICFFVRLIMPWRLPCWACMTLPLAVTLKRFLAPDLVFNLGIWLSFRPQHKVAREGDRSAKMLVRALKVVGFAFGGKALHGRRHGSPKSAGRRRLRLWQSPSELAMMNRQSPSARRRRGLAP